MKNFLKALYRWALVFALAFLFSRIINGQHISGSGTRGNPYVLYNAADVDSIHIIGVNKFYKLGNDVDMTGINWVPLTVASTDTFRLDGNGFTLSDLNILWNNTHRNSGFIKSYTPNNGTGEQTDTIFRNIVFYNTVVHFDSSTATGDFSVILNAGILIGEAIVTSGDDMQVIHNVIINKSRVWAVAGYGASNDINAGGFIGRLSRTISGGDAFNLHHCGLDSSIVYSATTNSQADGPAVGGLIGSTNWTNNSMISECYVKNSFIRVTGSGAEFADDMNVGGLVGLNTSITSAITSNSYVYNNTLRHHGRVGGISDPPYGGGIGMGGGSLNEAVSNSYVASNTHIRDNSAIENSDYLGWWWSRLITTVNHSTNYLDTTGLTTSGGAISWSRVYGENSTVGLGDSVKLRSTTLMKIQSTFVGWDFVNIWGFNPEINEGYPYLLWENPYTLEVDSPAAGFYLVNTTTNAKWTSTDFADTFVVSISYDNGDFFNIIDTVYADSVLAISLDTVTNEAIVRVEALINEAEEFSSVFIILSDRSILITDVSLAGHIATVVVLSAGMESWRLYQDADTTGVWQHFLGIKTGIDPDVLTFDTLVVSLVKMEDPFIKAEEFRDTTVYGFTVEFLDVGILILNPSQICYEHDQYLYGSRWIRDVSCGWANPPLEYGTSTIDGITVDSLLSVSYDIISSHSIIFTLPTGMNNYTPDSVQIGTRKYIISGQTLYMRDLLNNVLYPVFDLSPFFVSGNFGMQNNTGLAEFEGGLIIASNWQAWLFTTLEEPNLGGNFIYDIYQIIGDVVVVRNFFRGIHPKATKNLNHEWDK